MKDKDNINNNNNNVNRSLSNINNDDVTAVLNIFTNSDGNDTAY